MAARAYGRGCPAPREPERGNAIHLPLAAKLFPPVLKPPRILPLLVLFVLTGCRATPERVGEVVLAEGSLPVSFEVVGEGLRVAGAAPIEAALRTPEAWDSLRARLTFRRAPGVVDFAGAMLLVVAEDARSSGHALRFESVEVDSAGVVAAYTVFTPAADCLVDPSPQQPFQVVRLRNVEGPVRFERHTEALPCTLDRW